MEFSFSSRVLGRHEAHLWFCPSCELIAAHPVHWLGEAYSDAIAVTDTGIAARNWAVANVLLSFSKLSGLHDKPGLDLGGGHGLLVRILRDGGLPFRWTDPHAENLFARGFEDDGGPYEWLTLIEVFEHLTDPKQFLVEAIGKHQPDSIVFTTLPRPEIVPSLSWYYWSFETGQHVSFVTNKTLEHLARELGYVLESHGMFHLLTRSPRKRLAFRIATSRIGRLLGGALRARRQSLTQSDHASLVASLRSSTPH